jgi:putative sterol carrier protein
MRFLSAEWLDGMASSMAPAPPDVSVAIHQRVTGGPEGDVEYTIRLAGGTVSVEPGPERPSERGGGPGPADVEIVEDYETAAAISQGLLSPAAAFAAGRLRLGGPVRSLIEHQEALAAVGERMAALAAATTY